MKITKDSKLLITMLVVILIALAACWVAMGKGQQLILKEEGEATAVRWAQFLENNLTGLDDILSAGLITNENRMTFDFVTKSGNVLNYQVIANDGTIAYSSWSGDFDTMTSQTEAANAIRRGMNLSNIIDLESFTGDKIVVAEAYVPIRSEAGKGGAVKVAVDVTKRDSDLKKIRVIAFLGLTGFVALLCCICGTLVWQNIRNRRLAEEIQNSRGIVLEQLATGMPLEYVLSTLVASVERLMPEMICSVLLVDDDGERLRDCVGSGLPDDYRKAVDGVRIGPGVGSCGTAAYTRETVIVADIMTHPYWKDFAPIAKRAGLRSCWSQPVFSSDNAVLGTIAMYYRVPKSPTQSELAFFRTISHLVGIAVEQRKFQEKIAQMAHFDVLTGLPNRRKLQTKLQQSINEVDRDKNVALAIIDVDKFKIINDTYGHPMGDAVIKETARRLVACVEDFDVVARLGGDEFAIIFNGAKDYDQILAIAEQIARSVCVPIEFEGKSISTSTSIGVSFFPQHAKNADDLFKKADHALYQAKQKERGSCKIYDHKLHEIIREKQMLERDASDGLEKGEFVLAYQPKIDLRNGLIVGFEALARWHHPKLGLVSPEKFIPVAESSSLIIELGERLLNDACRQTVKWQSQGMPDVKVAVNVAVRQFNDPQFLSKVRKVLAQSGLNPKSLEFEITESLMIDDFEHVEKKLKKLNDLGISVSVDDFGTGYSSLMYLSRLPVQNLKIDRSFVKNLPMDEDSVAIVSSIIAMSKRMGLTVIAEGIESAEQVRFLEKTGCILGQGYLFAKPMAPEDVIEWYQTKYLKTIYGNLFDFGVSDSSAVEEVESDNKSLQAL